MLSPTAVVSVFVTGRRLDQLRAEAGQFFRLQFQAPGLRWAANPYSLSAPPALPLPAVHREGPGRAQCGGRPAGTLASLTLVGRRLARTDAWATAAFAMGPDRALAWAGEQPGIEALAVLPDGSRRWTPGLPAHLAPAQ